MTFEFNPDALDEYQEEASWYEEQRYRLGAEFVEAVEKSIGEILRDPGRYQPAGRTTQIFRMKRFPYYLHHPFNEAGQHVRILAVMHHRRRPDYWRERL